MLQPTIRALIVDDEHGACENLHNLLTEYTSEIAIVGVANNTKEAEKLINTLNPDVVFLDIEMPNENAFQFLTRLPNIPFEVVFVTAYDDYAIGAFKLNAVDYILKPISISELQNAVKKLASRLEYKKLVELPADNYQEIGNLVARRIKGNKLTLKDGSNKEEIEFTDIFFLEAQGSYSRIVFRKNNQHKEITMSVTLSFYEELLPDNLFYRIHRSFLINRLHVNRIIRDENDEVEIADKYVIPISRRKFSGLQQFLAIHKHQHG